MTTGLDVTSLGSADAMEAMLRRIGAERYHILHPFHRLLHGGRLSKGQVQAWALNRYYYQSRIPMKDAALISRCADRELRLEASPPLLNAASREAQGLGHTLEEYLAVLERERLERTLGAPAATTPPPSTH